MIQAVIFDIDNTLYDFDAANIHGMAAVYNYCRQMFGLDQETALSYYRKAWHLVEQHVGSDTAAIHNRLLRFQCMMELLKQPLFPHAQMLYRAYWDHVLAHMQPSPGIQAFMQNLKDAGMAIGIGTDMTAYIQYRKLELLGLYPYIDMVVTSEEAGAEKPSPKFFRLCVDKIGCPPECCAFIGDNIKKDVEGAIAYGLQGMWYSQGKEPKEHVPFPVICSFEKYLLQN